MMFLGGRVMAAALLGLSALLSGCAGNIGPTLETYKVGVNLPAETVRSWTVQSVTVDVPETLVVATDPNVRFPNVDIDWWEDPEGDRRAQVASIMKAATEEAVKPLNGTVPVTVAVSVRRFHALTPDALENGTRGWHDIIFDIAVKDAAGTVLSEEKDIDADLKALQGQAAKDAYARGYTQKVAISTRVTSVIRGWLAID